MVKINASIPSKINGISLGVAITTGSWGARPGTGDDSLGLDAPSDGDWFRATGSFGLGASYRYSSTIGEWVRPEIYGGSPTLLIRMRGSILPSAEDPAWTHYTENGGTITTDGTKVTFDGSSTNNKKAGVLYSHDQTHVFHFMQGLVQCTATGPDSGWQGGRIIGIVQHTNFTDSHKHKFHRVALDTNAPTASLASNSNYGVNNVESGGSSAFRGGTVLNKASGINDATTSEVFMEFYVSPSGSYVFFNNDITPSQAVQRSADMSNAAADNYNYYVGDLDTGERGSITVREAFWGKYTPQANEDA
tara:strand:+ start:2076 stop:2990 length:915 start_codon:yes stop_codon:yes gene_type:complete